MIIILTCIVSFIGLLWAANHLVTAAAYLAAYYRIPPLIIGLTIVALGSSLPEIILTISASISGQADLALGNAIGANIANIGLVLSLTILVRPLHAPSSLLRREFPLLFLIMLFTYSLMMDGYLGIVDGCLFLLLSITFLGYVIFRARSTHNAATNKILHKSFHIKGSIPKNALSFVIGLSVLPISAHFLVDSAVTLAHWLGVSELVIGLTIIAIGTCLPDLTTSIIAALKGQNDIALGNILGSNLFCLLLVVGFPGVINPSFINHALLWRDIPVLFLFLFVLLLIHYTHKNKLERWHGGLLLVMYLCYLGSLLSSAGHA